jgi:hypothetical protein
MKTACVTFDQPLWLKAVNIALSEQMNVVCRLGGFHVIMSYLGSMGTIMAGSGLTDALQTCYGSVTISHMLSGKAESRAVRGHMLADAALHAILLRDIVNSGVDVTGEVIDKLRDLYTSLLDKSFVPPDDATLMPDCVEKLQDSVVIRKTEIAAQSRTAKLWVQYLDYVQILKDFIRADRTCDWFLHLASLKKMLNIFAATGHRNYTKSVRLYLQLMGELPETHPWLYEQLAGGLHAVRRSDRFWAGLPTDLIIEQTMMRSAKSRGGLTHGRGMAEGVRVMWLKSLHRCATVHAAMLTLTNMDSGKLDVQHVELGRTRSKRDFSDLEKMVEWFEVHNPFDVSDGRLRSLSSGITAVEGDEVNCDQAEHVGQQIMLQMDNVIFGDVVLKKAAQARTLADVCCKVIGASSKLPVDSTVLFNRLLVVAQRSAADMAPYFAYELTALPTSLFKDAISLRKTDKSQLAKELLKNADLTVSSIAADHTVIDGGWLLHKVKWQQGGLHRDTIGQYERYILQHFGLNVTVIFDGYDSGPNTKDYEHMRRAAKCAPDIVFDINMPAYSNQSAFLANENNKKAFVSALMQHLLSVGLSVSQAAGDADTVIAEAALQHARSGLPVTVVANDTDILVMLLHHFHHSMSDITMQMETTKQAPVRRVCIRKLSSILGERVTRQLPVVHAISGCDTTSALYGHGKASIFKSIVTNQHTYHLTEVVGCPEATPEDVVGAGLQLLVLIYGGKAGDTLNHMRYATYMNIVASSMSPPRPERLPPTEASAKQHILRVHIQAVQWKTLKSTDKKTEDWGWKLIQRRYFPVTTDLSPAPTNLMNLVKCKCKMETRRPCSTMLCSCVKHGLPCLASCKHCTGQSCENATVTPDSESVIGPDNDDLVELLEEVLTAEDVIPDDCLHHLDYDIPWLDEEVID